MPIAEGTAALIGSALALAGTATSTGITAANKKAARKWQTRMMNIQRQQTLSDYRNIQSPEAQRRAYETSGLSTSLMYGGQGSAGGAQLQQSEAPSAPPTMEMRDPQLALNATQMMAAVSQMKLNEANAKKAEAEAENLSAKTETENVLRDLAASEKTANIEFLLASGVEAKARASLMEEQKRGEQIANDIQEALKENNIARAEELLKQEVAKTQIVQFDAEHHPQEWKAEMHVKASNCKYLISAANYNNALTDETMQRINIMNPAQIAYLGALTSKTTVERDLTYKEIDLKEAMTEKERKDVELVVQNIRIAEAEADNAPLKYAIEACGSVSQHVIYKIHTITGQTTPNNRKMKPELQWWETNKMSLSTK